MLPKILFSPFLQSFAHTEIAYGHTNVYTHPQCTFPPRYIGESVFFFI